MKTLMQTLGLAGLLLLGCGGSVDAQRFDQTCTQDSDCVAVYSGPLCQVCGGCANSAINTGAKASYDAEVKTVTASCPPRFGTTAECAACFMPETRCVSGACALALP